MSTQDIAALDVLIDVAAKRAAQLLAEDGSLVPIVIAQGETEGRIYGMPWRDDWEKLMMVGWLRDEFARFGAVRYVAVIESWMVVAKGDSFAAARRGLLGDRMPRDHPDRKEVVMFMAEDDAGNQRFVVRPIIRTVVGGPPQLGPPDPELTKGTEFTGRMAHLLAPRKATKQ